MNPNDPVQLDRLFRALEWSRYKLLPFREHRMAALKQFVGFHYSDSGASDRVPINLLQLATNIYLRQLVARSPRAMVSSKDPTLQPVAANMQAWMDKAAVGMRLNECLRLAVLNALFCIGIVKVGEESVGSAEIDSTLVHLGQPFAEVIDFDDWVHDITARRYDQASFAGHRYRLPLELIKDNDLFDKQAREQLQASYKTVYNERGDLRTSTLSQGLAQNFDEFEDTVELWDIWVPRSRLLITVPYQESVAGGMSGPALRVVQWTGRKEGPFHILNFTEVPSNVMPVSPASALMDLHELANTIWRKLGRQSDRQKTILGVAAGASDDGNRTIEASDGEAIKMDNPERCKEYRFGGIDQSNLAFGIQVKDLFVYLAGNLDALGGLSPQAHTLGQDEMLVSNSSKQVAEMQDRTVAFAQEVFRDLGSWWWKNPVLTYSAQRQVAGVTVQAQIPPQARQRPFEDLDFSIDPYSMQHETPSTKLQSLMQVMQSTVLPAAPMLAQQGIQVKWQQLLALVSKYANVPELADVLAVGPPPNQQPGQQAAQQAVQSAGQPPPPGMPPVTTRRNIRENRPTTTRQGQDAALSQVLMGGNPGGNPKPRQMAGGVS